MEFTSHQPEEDDFVSPAPPAKSAGKGPLKTKRRIEPVDIPERPNLIEIFDEFDVPEDERIQLCATTAAFYRALNKKRKNND